MFIDIVFMKGLESHSFSLTDFVLRSAFNDTISIYPVTVWNPGLLHYSYEKIILTCTDKPGLTLELLTCRRHGDIYVRVVWNFLKENQNYFCAI